MYSHKECETQEGLFSHKVLIRKCGKVVLLWGCIVLRKGYGAGSLDSFMASRDLCTYIAKYLVRIHGTLTDKV